MPGTWLLATARRACADAVHRRQRCQRLATAPPSARTAAATTATIDLADLLDQLVGLTDTETAEACDRPVAAVRSHIARVRQHPLAHLPARDRDDPVREPPIRILTATSPWERRTLPLSIRW